MVKRCKKFLAAIAFGVLCFSGSVGEASAFEPYYLNGDKTLPMIQNTGGIYNDGNTGLFMDLSTMEIEDVFPDGLAAKVTVSELTNASVVSTQVIHARFAEDGRTWVAQADGKWREVSVDSEDPASMAVYFMKQEMGDDSRREDFTNQIGTIAAAKTEEGGTVVPADAIPLPAVVPQEQPQEPVAAPAPNKEPKKSVKKLKPTKTKPAEVQVTITEAPQVEIVNTPDVQVDIT